MKFSAILAAIGLLPKNPEEAKATREAAAGVLTKVNEMFSAASLNLEQMLEAGPDSLKAFIKGLDQADAITTLNTQLSTLNSEKSDLTAKLALAATEHGVTKAALEVHAKLFAATGFKPEATSTEAEVLKAFDVHVEKKACAVLAKDGRPPIANLPKETKALDKSAEASLTAEQHLAAWEAMKPGSDERMAYGARWQTEILQADRARSSKTIPRS